METTHTRPFIITVDGPSGSGKSTVCRQVAGRLGIGYIDTGAMYRAVGWAAKQAGIAPDDETGLARILTDLKIDFQAEAGENRVFCNGTDVTREIRTPEVDRLASRVSAVPAVRRALLPLQRAFGRRAAAIIDGRDAGTVIFPNADLKIYLDADLETRARRRAREQNPDGGIDLEKVIAAIRERDQADASRAHAPLKRAPDALLIDTSRLSIEEVVTKIITLYRQRLQGKPA